MPTELMEWVTVLRDAGIGLTALLILIYYMRSAGRNDQRGDSIVQQLITVVSNNNDNLAAQQTQREKHTVALNENTAAVNTQTATVRELKEKTIQHLAELAGRQSLQGDTLDRMDLNVLKVVNGFGALDENIRTIASAVKDNPADHKHVLEALGHIATAQKQIFELIDSRLPERAKTDTPMTLPLATNEFRKRETDLNKVVKPEDQTPPLKPTG